MSAVAEERTLYAELWLSFGSVVRAYAGLAGGAVEVSAMEAELILSADSARLELRVELPGGTGNWRLSRGGATAAEGQLELLAEGRIAVDGNALDLDHAAIDLVALVTSAGAARDER